jgi:thiosulfate/3-mercaptopyruvate sulfurtransferase
MAGWTTLVQPETLAIALERKDLVVVDCRFALTDPNAGESAYRQSHVPGAVYAHLNRDLSDFNRVGAGRHPWPKIGDFLASLSTWGITPESQVVAYDGADGSIAARLWFLLRVLGHEKAAVLDGGWKRWVSLGLPTGTFVRARMPTYYAGAFDASRIVDAAGVGAHLEAGGVLLDARAASRFRGEEEHLDRVAGHVPGATSRPYADNLVDGRFKPPAQLADEYRALLGGKPADAVVAMCGSGVTACHLLLAMERAGLRGARLYAGSWSEWINDPSRPVASGAA